MDPIQNNSLGDSADDHASDYGSQTLTNAPAALTPEPGTGGDDSPELTFTDLGNGSIRCDGC